jgi:hypothetical protein
LLSLLELRLPLRDGFRRDAVELERDDGKGARLSGSLKACDLSEWRAP